MIENTQRDVNIALINELALIFNRLGIDTEEVLQAAGTKWNFLPFRPGLVGGHCIGVDPYYLTHKAQEIGYHPEMILAGRRINDNMGIYVAQQVVQADDPAADHGQGRARAGAGADVQGELPGPAQHQGRRRGRRSCRSTAARSTCSIRGSTPTRPSTNTACGLIEEGQRRALRRRHPGGRPPASSATWASRSDPRARQDQDARAVTTSSTLLPATDDSGLDACDDESSRHRRGRLHRLARCREILLERGDEVVGLDNLNDYYDVSLKQARLARLQGRSRASASSSSTSPTAQACSSCSRREKFERVVHLAAQAGVRYSLENPLRLRRQQPRRLRQRARRLPPQRRASTWSTPRRARSTAPTRKMPFSVAPERRPSAVALRRDQEGQRADGAHLQRICTGCR